MPVVIKHGGETSGTATPARELKCAASFTIRRDVFDLVSCVTLARFEDGLGSRRFVYVAAMCCHRSTLTSDRLMIIHSVLLVDSKDAQ
jgi:hypothetical protein